MSILSAVSTLLALAAFLVAALGVPAIARVALVPVGLFFLTLAMVLGGVHLSLG